MPSLTYLLRTSPSWECSESLQDFDNTLRDSLSGILNMDFSEDIWRQTSWPVSIGGLGVRKASDIALPAFLSSSTKCQALLQRILPSHVYAAEDTLFQRGLDHWVAATGLEPPPSDRQHLQKEWDHPSALRSLHSAIELAPNPIIKARLLGVSTPESGSFLHALPAGSLGTLMTDQEFRIAVALRVGAPVGQPHTCGCGVAVPSLSTHGLSCRRSAGRIPRHHAVNDLLRRALQSAGFPSTLEPAHLSLHNNTRPDGVTLLPWKNGKALAWDFTCCDSLAPSHVEFSAEESRYAASRAELLKHQKYAHLEVSHIFTPIAIECLGAIGKESITFLRDLGNKIKATTGDHRSSEYLLQRISISIQKGNAQAILGTLPTSASLSDALADLPHPHCVDASS